MPSTPAAVVRLRKVEHRLEKVLVSEYLRVVNQVLKAHDVPSITAAINRPDDLSSIVALWAERVDKVIIPQVLSVYREAAKNMLKRYPSLAALLPPDYLKVLRNVRADAFIATRVNYIQGVGEDMFRAASEQVQQSLEAGEGAEKLADRVRATLGTGVGRSRAIARTEAGIAVNSADFTVARDAGMKTKTWLATSDERTRDSHAELDGTSVPLGEPFDNGLMHPNDPDGDPEEIINCRCTMTFGFGDQADVPVFSGSDVAMLSDRQVAATDVSSFDDLDQVAALNQLPADDDEWEYFYHSVRSDDALDNILKNGVTAKTTGGSVFLSKDEIRTLGHGFSVVRVPAGVAKEGTDFVESGLTYREWTVAGIPADNVGWVVREVHDSETGWHADEAELAKLAKTAQGEDTAGLPKKYRHWFSISGAS